jgi:hypothetical protein
MTGKKVAQLCGGSQRKARLRVGLCSGFSGDEGLACVRSGIGCDNLPYTFPIPGKRKTRQPGAGPKERTEQDQNAKALVMNS